MTSNEDQIGETPPAQSQISFERVRFLFARNWWIVAISGAIVGCLSLAYCLIQTPMYAASATLYVTSGTDADALSAYQGSLASQQRVASYSELVSSDVILRAALDGSGLKVSLDDARTSVSAASDTETVLLTISAESSDPAVATALANRVAESMTNYVTSLEKPNAASPPLAKLTLVSPAVQPQEPFYPRTTWNTLLGIVVGLTIGVLVAAARERLDTRLRDGGDISRCVPTSVLAEIPAEDALNREPIIDFSVGASRASEGYRRLRTNLAFVRVDEPPRCIAVTSPGPGEGKTTTSLNLAAALAEDGHRVILVDSDLRRPSVAARLGVTSSVGFTTFLKSDGTVFDLVQPGPVDRLDLLVAGALPPNPAELLGSRRAQEGIAALRATYDYVILDTPPVLPVADAAILSSLVDGTLMVARAGRTRSQDLVAAFDSLAVANATILGVVVNGVTSTDSRYMYYSYGSLIDKASSAQTRVSPANAESALTR